VPRYELWKANSCYNVTNAALIAVKQLGILLQLFAPPVLLIAAK
jgi:hypothetical protein